MMTGFFIFILFQLFLVAMFVVLITRKKISIIEKTIKSLEDKVLSLTVLHKDEVALEKEKTKSSPTRVIPEQEKISVAKPATSSVVKVSVVKTKPSVPSVTLEQRFGIKLPVWTGGIALALSGIFLVKYSIEQELLGPSVRVIFGIIFGIILIAAAYFLRTRKEIPNGERITQALAGAGIAVLYAAVYTASSVYYLIPITFGFLGLAMVTGLAVSLSLLYGPPIALLGLLAGFITPVLFSTDNISTPMLFIYLYLVFSGLMIIIKQKRWWILSLPSYVAVFLWVMKWIMDAPTTVSGIVPGLFLIAISITILFTSKTKFEEELGEKKKDLSAISILNYIGLSASIGLMGILVAKCNLGLMEWGLFALISAGGIALCFYNEKLYSFVPWVAMAVNLIMLITGDIPGKNILFFMMMAFGTLYAASGYCLMFMDRSKISWSLFGMISSVSFYLGAYYKLHDKTHAFSNTPYFWGILGAGIAIVMMVLLGNIITKMNDYKFKDHVLTILVVGIVALLSIALTLELKREFLSIAFAVEVLLLSYIATRTTIRSLPQISAVVAVVFGITLFPQILLLIQLGIYSVLNAKIHLQQNIPMVQWPLFQLGLPAILFALSAFYLRKIKDTKIVKAFEISVIVLIAIMSYYLMRHIFHVEENILFKKASFFERGATTNIFFLFGIICMFFGQKFNRITLSKCGFGLAAMSVFRIIYFDILIFNPLWTNQGVGKLPILNFLLITYGLPVVWIILISSKYLKRSYSDKIARPAILILTFVLPSLLIRQLFHGNYLHEGVTSNFEIYSYSIAWIVLGAAIATFGIIKKSKMVRVSSLILMVLVVGKVFLYDASELEGLYRVCSFLGLGLSLIGLSYFYSKFVFRLPE